MIRDDYERIRKIVNDYFRLVTKLLTGEGTVPAYILRKLQLEGRKIQGLIPRIAHYGASLFPGGDHDVAMKNLREEVQAAQLQTDLAIEDLRTKTLQAAQNALIGAAAAGAGAAVFGLVVHELIRRRQEMRANWSRTVKTGMHNAKSHGSAAAIGAYPQGDLTQVYKVCQPTACERCIKAYQHPDGTPRIFTVGELKRNGTNAGRKADAWLPVLGCMHPHCQCTLQIV